jgi:hypothetical protein
MPYRKARAEVPSSKGMGPIQQECRADRKQPSLSGSHPSIETMTVTYTSDDLSQIAASILGHAREAGLTVVPGIKIEKEVDVRIASEDVDISSALQVAVLVKAPFISVDSDWFWTDRLRHTEGYEDLPPAAERLVESAKEHNDSLMSVTVTWVADGLTYEWMAQSGWIGPLLIDIDAAMEVAETESETEREDRLEEYYSNYRAAVTALAESPKYRGEQVGKRRHVAPSIVAEAGLQEINDVVLTRQIMPDANKIVNAKVYEFEQDFRARKDVLADELRAYPAWQRVYTKAKRKDAAVGFLTKKADGYRLSTDLAEEISEAAAIPVNIARPS